MSFRLTSTVVTPDVLIFEMLRSHPISGMASTSLQTQILLLLVTTLFFAAPAAAFGAGNIHKSSVLLGYNA